MTNAEYQKFVRLWLDGATRDEIAAACSVAAEGVEEWQAWALRDPAAVAGWTGRPEPIGYARECRWITGDVRRRWAYCNAPALLGKSYCPAHAERARLGQDQPKKAMRAWR